VAYHPGATIYLPGFDWNRVGEIPVGTVRKFGQTSQHPAEGKSFGYTEGEKVKRLTDAGKRVIGTFTVPVNSQWTSMPDADWRGYVSRYIQDVPTRVVEVGNEPGKLVIDGYFRKLKIASELLRAAGRRVLMGAPYPGAEMAFLEAAERKGAWEWIGGVCCHPYGTTPAQCLMKVRAIRGRLDSYGMNNLPIHLTEWGWATGPPGVTHSFIVSEQKQAEYVRQSFANWKQNAEALRLANCLYYSYNDWNAWGASKPSSWYHCCGAIRLDYSRKPSYAALAEQ
jgi:hypothetical protein